MKLTFQDKQKTLFRRVKKLKQFATRSEIEFKNILELNKIKFIFQKAFIKDNFYCIVDFYLPKPHKICIEIDGEYHNQKNMQKKDLAKDNYLKSRGFKIIRIKNNEVKNFKILDLF